MVPEEPGDLAYFLVGADIGKGIPGEWILMGFLSKEWFDATKNTHGAAANNNYAALVKWRAENLDLATELVKKHVKKHLEWRSNNPEYEHAHARMMRERRIQKEKDNPELLKERMRKVHAHLKYRWKCLITGHVSNSNGLTRYQNNRGIDPTAENRIRIN